MNIFDQTIAGVKISILQSRIMQSWTNLLNLGDVWSILIKNWSTLINTWQHSINFQSTSICIWNSCLTVFDQTLTKCWRFAQDYTIQDCKFLILISTNSKYWKFNIFDQTGWGLDSPDSTEKDLVADSSASVSAEKDLVASPTLKIIQKGRGGLPCVQQGICTSLGLPGIENLACLGSGSLRFG